MFMCENRIKIYLYENKKGLTIEELSEKLNFKKFVYNNNVVKVSTDLKKLLKSMEKSKIVYLNDNRYYLCNEIRKKYDKN